MAQWAINKGWTKAFVLQDDTTQYNKSVCAGFNWLYPAVGGTIAGSDSFLNDDPSIASQITRLKAEVDAGNIDLVYLCSFVPGGATALRQIRAVGIDLPVLSGSAMDGSYWADSVPDLKSFFVPVQGSIFGDDPNPEIAKLDERYKAKFNSTPATSYAYPIYAWMELWARAVEKAGTTEGTAVAAVLNTFTDEPTVLGPRTFTDTVHFQANAPFRIVELTAAGGKVVDEVRITQTVPDAVLYRLGN